MITFESIRATVESITKPVAYTENNPFSGVTNLQEITGLMGSGTIIISGTTAYYGPDICSLEQVKVVIIPEPKPPNILFWENK